MHKVQEPLDYEALASQLVRALRGKRSCAELSRRAGYRSNIVHRWESGKSWPTAAGFIALHARMRPQTRRWMERFFHMKPAWTALLDATSKEAIAAFLQHLRGKTTVVRVAALAERNRYSVARWLDGTSEPKLPEFLRLIEAMSRRVLDFVAAIEDPARVPCVREAWSRQQLARKAAYELPWSHAVLRALELQSAPRGAAEQEHFIARKLGIDSEQVREALHVLQATEQVKRTRLGYRLLEVRHTDTGLDPVRAHELKVAWTATALARLKASEPGHYGWSLFAVSRRDLERLHNLHLQYVRAMQEVIATSTPSECVGLYCAQLLELSGG